MTFVRHYAEMWIAMLLGMAVLGIPASLLLGALGVELRTDAPALSLLAMATFMTIPMVAWMRYRGHGWRPSNEMALSMFLPTFAVIGLLAGGTVTEFGTLMTIEHVAMAPSMLAAMLLRYGEYSGAAHAH